MPVSMCVRVRMRACVRVFLCVCVKPKQLLMYRRGLLAGVVCPLRCRFAIASFLPPPKSRRQKAAARLRLEPTCLFLSRVLKLGFDTFGACLCVGSLGFSFLICVSLLSLQTCSAYAWLLGLSKLAKRSPSAFHGSSSSSRYASLHY